MTKEEMDAVVAILEADFPVSRTWDKFSLWLIDLIHELTDMTVDKVVAYDLRNIQPGLTYIPIAFHIRHEGKDSVVGMTDKMLEAFFTFPESDALSDVLTEIIAHLDKQKNGEIWFKPETYRKCMLLMGKL